MLFCFAATLVDVVGSAALVTVSNRGGVSLSINTIYLNPMPGGEDVHIDARVIKLGKDIATVEVILTRASTGMRGLVLRLYVMMMMMMMIVASSSKRCRAAASSCRSMTRGVPYCYLRLNDAAFC